MKSNLLSLFRYRVIYVALSIALFVVIIENAWYIILAPFFGYYLVKKHPKLIKYIGILLLIYIALYTLDYSKSIEMTAQYKVVVNKVYQRDDYTLLLGSIDGQLVNVYLSDKEEVVPGDVYSVEGELVIPAETTIPGNFGYKNYLLSKGIKYQLFTDKYELINHRFNIGIIAHKIDQYIDEHTPLSKTYIKTFILADKSEFDRHLLEDVNKLGISHLFAVSGLHIGLLVVVISKMLETVKVKEKTRNVLISILLTTYMIITAFSPSVVRASLMFIFIVINKRYRMNLSNIDILALIFVLSLLINPFFYKNPGFVLTFAVTLFLLLSLDILKNFSGVQLLFIVGFISFLSTIPLIMNMNYELNLLTLIFNVILISLMTYIILPSSYITFIFPIFDELLYVLIKVYNSIIHVLSNIEFAIIYGSFIYAWEIMVYYIIVNYYLMVFAQIKKRRRLLAILSIFMVFAMNSNLLTFKKSVVFLDVKGDSTFIMDNFNRCNILIDTGDDDEYNSVINYIKSRNVKRIDYLFISHFHSDHYGEMDDIIANFNIGNIVTPNNVESFYGSQISCGSISIIVYDLSLLNQNENNNSIVMSLYIENKHYLFTGDSEKEREKEFIELYNINVDYLKIPHHGSSTSSSNEFLDAIRPSEAFVMAHRLNKFNHPDYFVMSRYENKNITVHRTDIYGTIEIEYFFGIERKNYNKP